MYMNIMYKNIIKSISLFVLFFLFLNISNAATTTTKTVVKKTTTKAVVSTPNYSKEIKNTLAKSFTVSAWVPYWQAQNGSDEVIRNISKIDIVSPFSYEMQETGTIKNPMKLATSTPFANMIDAARANGKLVIPSILWWGDTQNKKYMENVLSDPDLRGSLIFDIQTEIKKYNFDGIDIDFEGKTAETREPFSKFLTELSTALHKTNKILICTIESRVPVNDRYATVTPELLAKIEYSNDFKAIGKACDQVRIMAYDQDTTDVNLNKIRGDLYKPVADIDWVKKVLTLAMWDIPAKKIIVGVPTYGNKFEVKRDINGKITGYIKIGSMNWVYADQDAKDRGITPKRDASGELSYTYKDSVTGKEFLVWYSDAEAIKDKVNIAKLYGLGGVAIFKVDGNNDKNIWKIF